MNCPQADRLLLLYCENQVHPHLRQQIEKHLQECPTCRHKLALTQMENEALRYTGDIPTMSSDFCRKVMASINHINSTSTPANHHNWFRAFYRRIFQRSNLGIVGGFAAAFLLFIILGKSAITPITTPVTEYASDNETAHVTKAEANSLKDSSTNNQQLQIGLAGDQVAGTKAPAGRQAMEQSQPNADGTTPSSIFNAPDYSRPESGILPYNRGGNFELVQQKTFATTEPLFIPNPGYLPGGYSLTKAEYNLDNVLILTYGGTGSEIILKVIPQGGENKAVAAASPEKERALTSSAENELAPDKAMRAADGETMVGNPAADMLVDAPGVNTISWNVLHAGQPYTIQVSGAFPPGELVRIATSCKGKEE